jgi:hypothetical protein
MIRQGTPSNVLLHLSHYKNPVMSDNVFYEEQRLTQWWIKIILAVLLIGLTTAAIVGILTKKTGLLPATAIVAPVAVLILFFRSLKLQVRINGDSINYRFLPIQRKYRTIKQADILKMDVITYDPVEDYGGWGIRFGEKGTAYTAKGNHGLSIHLVTEKNILIGTSKPQELQSYLQNRWHDRCNY